MTTKPRRRRTQDKERRRDRFRETVGDNIQKRQARAATYGYLNLPQGITVFKEEPGGKAVLDILPYEPTDKDHHPDWEDIVRNEGLWYKRPFKAHRGIGVENESVVCPTTVGKKCPICRWRAQQIKEGGDSKEISATKASYRSIYIVVPLGMEKWEEEPHVWNISDAMFLVKLEEELKEDEDKWRFPSLYEGLTLSLRFASKTIGNSPPFAETSRIDFMERSGPYPDKILEEVPNLDEMLIVHNYKELEAMFYELDDEREPDETAPGKAEPEKADDSPEPSEEGEVECVACEGTGTNTKGRTCIPCKGSGYTIVQEEPEPAPKPRRERPKAEEEPDPDSAPEPGEDLQYGDKCPEGYVYGEDNQEYEECEKCSVWEPCIEAKEAEAAK